MALPTNSVISIVGPGTGLGVAQLIGRGEAYEVIETEGGHIGFAPIDSFEDELLKRLRERYGRVSVERIVSGKGLAHIREALAGGGATEAPGDAELWAAALSGQDRLGAAALERFCLSLGAVAGDIALAHGASALVLAGGVGLRLAGRLRQSGFAGRFVGKGRFEERMHAIPVKLAVHPEPGLFGAAAAYARAYPG